MKTVYLLQKKGRLKAEITLKGFFVSYLQNVQKYLFQNSAKIATYENAHMIA